MENLNIVDSSAPKKYTQAQRIVQHLERFGFISPQACIHRVPMITTKLATRISEISRRTGIEPEKKVRDADTGFMRYFYSPVQIKALKEYYHV